MKSLTSFLRKAIKPLQATRSTSVAQTGELSSKLGDSVDYIEKYSKHRMLLNIYDIKPVFCTAYIAPNATLVGEVYVDAFTSIWGNVVLRGDLNAIKISNYTSIGEGTVVHTANSLPTGLPATCVIGKFVTIQANCSLYSCVIEDETLIGARSVIMEGSWVEKGSVILPNSVVPPGRIIPARQLWGGNPVEYIRDITETEQFANYAQGYAQWEISQQHLAEFNPWNSSYLQLESAREDVDGQRDELTFRYFRMFKHQGVVKYYP